jgi:hypothetical protein
MLSISVEKGCLEVSIHEIFFSNHCFFPIFLYYFINLQNPYQTMWKPSRFLRRIWIQTGRFHQQLYYIYISWLLSISIDLPALQFHIKELILLKVIIRYIVWQFATKQNKFLKSANCIPDRSTPSNKPSIHSDPLTAKNRSEVLSKIAPEDKKKHLSSSKILLRIVWPSL